MPLTSASSAVVPGFAVEFCSALACLLNNELRHYLHGTNTVHQWSVTMDTTDYRQPSASIHRQLRYTVCYSKENMRNIIITLQFVQFTFAFPALLY